MSLRFSEEDLAAYRQRQIEQTAKKLPSLPDADDVARMRGKVVPTEDQEQRIVAQFLDLLGFRWTHCPNEGKRNVVNGARLKASGMKKGTPDILIFDPPPDSDWVGVAIELKRQRGGKISKEQQEWLDALSERGWLTRCCKGSGETIEFLREIYKR